MSRPFPVAVLSCLLLLCSALFLPGCSGSSAGCARGEDLLSAEPSSARPGETFVLRGRGFGGGCDDSNLPFREEPPQKGIRIELRQGGRTWDLATVDADRDYHVEAKLKVPENAGPGGAVVVTRDDYGPMEVPFRVLGGGPG